MNPVNQAMPQGIGIGQLDRLSQHTADRMPLGPGNTPEKERSSKVEFSRKFYGGDSDEAITIHGQSDH
jgi:hypothetical protein